MTVISVTEAKENLEKVIERVMADAEPAVLRTDSGDEVVLLSMNEYPRHEIAMSTKMNCACAVGFAIATSCGMPLAAPMSGSVAWASASISARINANCPISGIILYPCY